MLFRPGATAVFNSRISVIRTGLSNFYIYDTGDTLIAFDTGMNPMLCRRGLDKLDIDANRVSHIFLTHSDYDHAGGLSVFKNAQSYISEKEVPMVTGKKPRLLFIPNRRRSDYTALKNREQVAVGRSVVEIIEAPGHTPGSACYIVDNYAMATGDLLRIGSNGEKIPFLFLQNMSHSENKNTLEQFKKERIFDRVSFLLTGHSGAANAQ